MDQSKPEVSRATLGQVAALAGVSVKTASRALKGERYVAPGTSARVRAAAEQLTFRPNAVARDFRVGARSTSVGLLIGDLSNPFYAGLARGAERQLHAVGLRLVCASTEEDPVREREFVDEMLERRIAAILMVTSTDDHPYVEPERRFGTPVVFLDRAPSDIVTDTILLDNIGGMRAAVEHLASVGHERIGILSCGPRFATSRERLAAFEAAMAYVGLDGKRYARDECDDIESARRATVELLGASPRPTALIATNNRLTIGALSALHASEHDVGFVGFDDFELSDVLGTTVVTHAPAEMGAAAARFVIGRLGGDVSPARRLILPTRLVIRESSSRGIGVGVDPARASSASESR